MRQKGLFEAAKRGWDESGCVRSALAIAPARGYRSIAFPLIGSGTGGFSPERALDIMQDETRKLDYDGEVRFVRFRRAA